MITLFFICLLGVFSQHCLIIEKNFHGSSKAFKDSLLFIGVIGFTLHLITTIWSFWHYDWWQSLLVPICAFVLTAITAPIFQRNLVGMILSPISALIFSILSIIGLL